MKSKLLQNKYHILTFLFLNIISRIISLDNGLGQTPPMGWNSWNKFACNISEDLIKKTADAIVSSGLKAAGYTYLNLDDCWQINRDSTGKIIADPNAFPSGIKSLADYIHSLDLKFGLYSDAGYLTCQKRPGSLLYEEIDAQTYAEWEVDYLKYDNCYNDLSSPKIRYPVMRDALLKAKRPIFYSMCEWGIENPAEWGAEVGNSWRTTGDIEDKWDSFINILDLQVGLEKYARPGAWNDPDMLEVGNGGMTDNEYQSHFALWALLKAPLLIGCDVLNMSENTKKILLNEEIIKINQDSLGKQGSRISRVQKGIEFLEVWAGELSNGYAIILFNRTTNEEEITTTFKDFGFTAPGGNLRNLLVDENYGYVNEKYTAKVPAHSVVVLKLHQYCSSFMGNCENVETLKLLE